MMPFIRASVYSRGHGGGCGFNGGAVDHGGSGGSCRGTIGPSCQAIRSAVCSLHRLDDFTTERIGSGFFSNIYKVVHVVTKQVMVLKMNVSHVNRPNVLREIQLMNRLSHPNVLRLLGVCVDEGQLHALVEYVNGGSLEELLADKPRTLPWSVRIRIGCDIAKGLKYLHSEGVMHRDLTSKNILIKRQKDDRLVAVVADLGLACAIPDLLNDKQLSVVGSPYWMAPECIASKRYNEKVDIFSYGIVLCEIIARVEADPDVLPRTKKFGVDYVAFSKMAADCPLHFLHLTFTCCQIDPKKRPSFIEIVKRLEAMKSIGQMAVILADLSRLGIYGAGPIIDRLILERILDMREPKRTRSDELASFSLFEEVTAAAASTVQPPRRRYVPVTPLTIGKVMSKDDAHYAPHTTNPFTSRFRDASAKITEDFLDPFVDSSSLSSPRGSAVGGPTPPLAPPATPLYEAVHSSPRRRCHSLPGTPTYDASFQFDFASSVADVAREREERLGGKSEDEDDEEWRDEWVEEGERGGSSECGGSSVDSGAIELDVTQFPYPRCRAGLRRLPGGCRLQGSTDLGRLTQCQHDEIVALCLECIVCDGPTSLPYTFDEDGTYFGGRGGCGARQRADYLDSSESAGGWCSDPLAQSYSSVSSSLSLDCGAGGSCVQGGGCRVASRMGSASVLSPAESHVSSNCYSCAGAEVEASLEPYTSKCQERTTCPSCSFSVHSGFCPNAGRGVGGGGGTRDGGVTGGWRVGCRWEDERWRSPERFQELVRRWEAQQEERETGVIMGGMRTKSKRLPMARRKMVEGSSGTYIIRPVEELRRIWENVIRLHVASCHMSSTTKMIRQREPQTGQSEDAT